MKRTTITAAALILAGTAAGAETLIDPAQGPGYFGGKVCQEHRMTDPKWESREEWETAWRGCMTRAWAAQVPGMIADEAKFQSEWLIDWRKFEAASPDAAEAYAAKNPWVRMGTGAYTPAAVVAAKRTEVLFWLR